MKTQRTLCRRLLISSASIDLTSKEEIAHGLCFKRRMQLSRIDAIVLHSVTGTCHLKKSAPKYVHFKSAHFALLQSLDRP